MAETEVLNQLQIRRRELENEVASLSQKEILMKSELKKLEEAIIAELEETIEAKKLVLSDLVSKKGELEKKLEEVQRNSADSPKQEESYVSVRPSKTAQSEYDIETNSVELSFVG